MIHTTLILVSLWQTFAVEAPTDSTKQPIQSHRYYPLHQGDTWEFQLLTNGAQIPVTNVIKRREKIDDMPMFLLHSMVNGTIAATEHLSHNPKGLYRHRYNSIICEPSILLLKNPVVLGDSWETETTIGTEKCVIKCKVLKELQEVEVPAGKFEALQLQVATVANGQPIKTTYYLVPDIGIVKQRINMSGQKIKIDLVKFTPAPKQKTVEEPQLEDGGEVQKEVEKVALEK